MAISASESVVAANSARGVDGGEGPDGTVNRVLYQGEVGGIGEFRCPAGSRWWEQENRIGDRATIAFARDPVGISRPGGPAMVATANEAMLYNAGQAYRRKRMSEKGDRCEFLVFKPKLIAEIVSAHDPRAGEDEQCPLKWGSAWVTPGIYMSQRGLYHHVRAAEKEGLCVDRMLVDECLVTIADTLVGAAARGQVTPARRESTSRDHRVWVEGAKDYLARHFRESLSLSDVGEAVGLSVFHLCRLFKAHCGVSVHSYLRSMRARASLELLAEGSMAVGTIAADLGFCNQSHFTRAFRHEFGARPTQVRRALRGGMADRELWQGRGK